MINKHLFNIIEAFSQCYGAQRVELGNVACKLMAGQAPNRDDIATIIQAFAMQPMLCTLDLQDSIDAINEIHGTSFTVRG